MSRLTDPFEPLAVKTRTIPIGSARASYAQPRDGRQPEGTGMPSYMSDYISRELRDALAARLKDAGVPWGIIPSIRVAHTVEYDPRLNTDVITLRPTMQAIAIPELAA